MKYYLPIHINGGNRGCEAITKATMDILGCTKEQLVVYSSNIEIDRSLGLEQRVTLVARKQFSFLFKVIRKIRNVFVKEQYSRNLFTYNYLYNPFLRKITKHDIMLSTGGDMMCYADNEVIYTNEYLYDRRIRTVLWGCSIGEENLTFRKLETLKHFSAIYARESLTKELLLKKGLKNIFLFPDPAFILKAEACKLPSCFASGKVVGINISNFVSSEDGFNTLFGKNLIKLIDYIIENTSYHILLVPHVFWGAQDDRIICNLVKDRYISKKRISLLDADCLNYCQLRYVISNCTIFMGARTHAVISAYSTCVPTVAIGYSIKSGGIAKDLQLPETTLVDGVHLINDQQLLNAFQYVNDHKLEIRKHLENIISEYTSQVWEAKKMLDSL